MRLTTHRAILRALRTKGVIVEVYVGSFQDVIRAQKSEMIAIVSAAAKIDGIDTAMLDSDGEKRIVMFWDGGTLVSFR